MDVPSAGGLCGCEGGGDEWECVVKKTSNVMEAPCYMDEAYVVETSLFDLLCCIACFSSDHV